MIPVALTIAGSDPSGGAGIQADLKTFHRFGVYGQAVITLLTVQNTRGVTRVEPVSPQLALDQLDAVLDDIRPHAAKAGALGSAAIVYGLAERAAHFDFPLVVDPVLFSKNGTALASPEAVEAMRSALLPRCWLITPNVPEAEELTGVEISSASHMREAARKLIAMGVVNTVIKGGHLKGAPIDVLLAGGSLYEFSAERIETRHTHGTGCAYSAAITAGLAIGQGLPAAVQAAKEFVTRAIRTQPSLGNGQGPLNLWA